MRRHLGFLIVGLVGLAGCVTTSSVECPGGIVCPATATCAVESTGAAACIGADQIGACSDAESASHAECKFDHGTRAGRCDNGICFATQCGNGVVDLGEACDDGNLVSGDGCRADCQKIEACGDGIVDATDQCDDGNQNPADGCDACRITSWTSSIVIGGDALASKLGIGQIFDGITADHAGNVYYAIGATLFRIDAAGAITTIAGGGDDSSENIPATDAKVGNIQALTVDDLGEVYFATSASAVYRVSPEGLLTTVIGGPGFGGDGGPAILGRVAFPHGLAVDDVGNLYIADTNNNRVRRVDNHGIITTIVGTGAISITGDPTAGDGGLAKSAALNIPGSLAIHAGTLYIGDGAHCRIRTIDLAAAAPAIATFAGTTTSCDAYSGDGNALTTSIFNPLHLAVDDAGRVFVDEHTSRVRVVDHGMLTTFTGTLTAGNSGDGGPPGAALIGEPGGIATSGNTVFIADSVNAVIRRVDPSASSATGIITRFAGNGDRDLLAVEGQLGTGARLTQMNALAIDSHGDVFVDENGQSRIRKISRGVMTTVAGTSTQGFSGDGGPATAAALGNPQGIAIDAADNLYIADSGNQRIRRIDAITGTITTVAGTGAIGSTGDNGPAILATLDNPSAIAVDAAGDLYVTTGTVAGQMAIRKIDAAQRITTLVAKGKLAVPIALAVDPTDGTLVVADFADDTIQRVAANGTLTRVAGVSGAGDTSGDNGPATLAHLGSPQAIAVDASGAILIGQGDYFVRKIAAGTITHFAGTGNDSDENGDGGPASAAGLYGPIALATRDGAIAVIDSETDAVRRIDAAGIITTIAGAVDPIGVGLVGIARLASPRAIVRAAPFTLFATGASGTVEATRPGGDRVASVIGRYGTVVDYLPTGALARFGGSSFGSVGGVAYDAADHTIYLAETSKHRIDAVMVVDPADESTWTIATYANTALPVGNASFDTIAGFTGGAAATARFRGPTGLYFDDATRTLYVADTGNNAIRAIDVASGQVRTVAGAGNRGSRGDGGPAVDAWLDRPEAITLAPTGELAIADTGNQRVRRVDHAGVITTLIGAIDPLAEPRGLAFDSFGDLYVTSRDTVRLLTPDAPLATAFGGGQCLSGIAIVDDATLQVADACSGRLYQLSRH